VTTFLLLAALFAAVALAFVLPPLLRAARPAAEAARGEANALIYREQLVELRAERERGAMGEEPFQRAMRELERRIVAEAGTSASAAQQGPHALAAVLVALAIPLIAGVGYWHLGAPFALQPGATEALAPPRPGELEEMVEKLSNQLQKSPGDAEGWALLARSLAALGQHERAAQSFSRAAQLLPNDANVLADYADALAVTRGRQLAGEPMQLVRRALAADPQHLKALALAGAGEFQAGEHAAAAGHWRQVLALLPPDSEFARQLQGSLQQAEQMAAKGPTTKPAVLRGTVSLDPKVAAAAAPGDTVFVIARPAEGGRMPLAVARTTVSALPYRFALDDSMAMDPDLKLSKQSRVLVVARVSKSGLPASQRGDLEGVSQPVAPTASGLEVVISKTIE